MDLDYDLLKNQALSEHTDNPFHVRRGDVVTTLVDLANCIDSISLEDFSYHVDYQHDDFAQWIQDVLSNPLLARDLRLHVNINSKDHYVKTIRDHLAWLEGY